PHDLSVYISNWCRTIMDKHVGAIEVMNLEQLANNSLTSLYSPGRSPFVRLDQCTSVNPASLVGGIIVGSTRRRSARTPNLLKCLVGYNIFSSCIDQCNTNRQCFHHCPEAVLLVHNLGVYHFEGFFRMLSLSDICGKAHKHLQFAIN